MFTTKGFNKLFSLEAVTGYPKSGGGGGYTSGSKSLPFLLFLQQQRLFFLQQQQLTIRIMIPDTIIDVRPTRE
jgi:hypothetical protein